METNLTKTLAKLVRETPSAIGKADIMRATGIIRESLYGESQDPKEMRLATNCYKAAERFYKRLGE